MVLGPRLTSLKCLQQLYLSNDIGAAGANALGPHLTSLQQLYIDNNMICTAGAAALGPHLASLMPLQQLNLSYNCIGNEGARALGPHLCGLMALQGAYRSYNDIGAKAEGRWKRTCPALPPCDVYTSRVKRYSSAMLCCQHVQSGAEPCTLNLEFWPNLGYQAHSTRPERALQPR